MTGSDQGKGLPTDPRNGGWTQFAQDVIAKELRRVHETLDGMQDKYVPWTYMDAIRSALNDVQGEQRRVTERAARNELRAAIYGGAAGGIVGVLAGVIAAFAAFHSMIR